MWFQDWNYLRVRGEYAEAREKKIGMLELPPRTRRILQLDNIPTVPLGTTSAYAENTQARGSTSGVVRNYLRVRGEYTIRDLRLALRQELPPRTRRIP